MNKISNPFSGFKNGFIAPFEAMKLIAVTPSILVFILVPLTINIVLYLLLFKYGAETITAYSDTLVASMSRELPSWAQWVSPVAKFGLRVIAWLVLLIFSAMSFTIVSGILAAPFNDVLSERVARVYSERLGIALPPHQKLSVARSIKMEIKRTVLLVLGAVFAFVLGMLPVMQLPALLLGACLIAFEYFGIPSSRLKGSLRSAITFTLARIPTSLGFGLFMLIVMAIPFVSVIYVPLSVVTGTILYIRESTTNGSISLT